MARSRPIVLISITGGSNPFEAHVAAARETATIGKIRGQWSHAFGHAFDATVWVAGAHGFDNRTSLVAAVPGFGTLAPRSKGASWAEYGVRIGYGLPRHLGVEVFADGVTGEDRIGTRTHVGAAIRLQF